MFIEYFSTVIRLLLDSLNLSCCRGIVKSDFFLKKPVSQESADILTKLLQQCFLFFIVVVIPGHNLGNSQVSVNRTIGPTLVFIY